MKRAKQQSREKPTVAFASLSGCEGCSFAILDLGNQFFNLLRKKAKLGDFRLIEEQKERSRYDIAFVDGAPLTKENVSHLKELRERTGFLVALGSCAHLGAFPGIKNYRDKRQVAKKVYPKLGRRLDNFDIHPVSHYVKVDLVIPGCPIDGEEFLRVFADLIRGVKPVLSTRPICDECQKNHNPCLLQQGEPCLGPVIQGGCDSVCLNFGYYCRGCRGILPQVENDEVLKTLHNKLIKMVGKKKLEEILEIYNIKEEWDNELTS